MEFIIFATIMFEPTQVLFELKGMLETTQCGAISSKS